MFRFLLALVATIYVFTCPIRAEQAGAFVPKVVFAARRAPAE
jgi:hypothetical protein